MKIGLMGFGRAGKAVASIILNNEKYILQWVLRKSHILEHRSVPEFFGIKSNEPGYLYSIQSINIKELMDEQPVDYIVDFSTSNAIYEYGEAAANKKVKIISAISHYAKKEIEFLKRLSENTAVFWSPNITIGVNFLMLAARFLKKMVPTIDTAIIEEHYRQKENVSGTALKICEYIDVPPSEIKSIRVGGIVSKHEVIFGFPYQTVRIIHEAISREAFGNGVLFVADNLKDKEKGLYKFEDIMLPYFQHS